MSLEQDPFYRIHANLPQPKRRWGMVMRDAGQLVPHVFGDHDAPFLDEDQSMAALRDGLESGKYLIVRSDHTDEYTGLSGEFRSLRVRPDDHDRRDELMSFQQTEDIHRLLLGDRRNDIRTDGLGFSVWEYIDGAGASVLADSAVTDKYHVFMLNNYFQVYNGDVAKIMVRKTREVDSWGVKIPSWYETVRGQLDSSHCYLTEIVVDNDGQIWNLQGKRNRDFAPVDFAVESIPPGAVEALFVRGATALDSVTAGMKYGVDQKIDCSVATGSYMSGASSAELQQLQVYIGSSRSLGYDPSMSDMNTRVNLPAGKVHEHGCPELILPQVYLELQEEDYKQLIDVVSSPDDGRFNRTYAELTIVSDGTRGYVQISE